MNDNVENLMLEHLKRFQAGQDRIEHVLSELKQRMGRIELAFARANGSHEEGAAEQSVRIDYLSDRVDRIERRLELSHG